MYGSLDISVSGMIAQRTRMESVASNLASWNAYTRDADGNPVPYRGRRVMFAPGDPAAKTAAGRRQGVHVAEVQVSNAPPAMKYEPWNPLAYQSGEKKGYVPISDVNPVLEYFNAMEAARSYEANVAAAEVTKSMMAQSLRLLA